jgi:hypothetical protein
MAFDKLNLAPLGASLTNRDVPTPWSYITTDTLATTKASGYFNNVAGLLTNNDYMFLACSDGSDMVLVTSGNGLTPVTVAAFITAGDLSADAVETIHIKDANVTADKLAPDSVTTVKILDANVTAAKILDSNVTLAKLDDAITPSHVVKFANASYTTLGGAAAEVISVSGVLGTDVVHVTMREEGATPRTILKAVPTADTITVTFSGDPSTDHVVAYSVLRAVA